MTAGSPDPEVLRRHIAALRGAVMRLRKYAGRSERELQADTDVRWAVERGLQIAIQNVLDVATHLCAAAGVDTPNYGAAIIRLGEIGVLKPDFAHALRPIAGFRNVLVHAYLEVDPSLLAKVLRDRLDDLVAFADQVESTFDRR